ncbi:MAG TPA: HAMP domain-containing sensor histidine kinase [Pseudonocardiaceae bacterium]|nr:HAMP domain-containing sensor histidine kinase [Pseudonocardiaceae bacterium]
MGRWSLRAKLLVGQLLVLALVCIVIGIGTEISLNRSQTSQLDNQLLDASHRAAGVGPGDPGDPGGGPYGHHPTPPGQGLEPCGAAATTDATSTQVPFGQGIGTLTAQIVNGQVRSASVLAEKPADAAPCLRPLSPADSAAISTITASASPVSIDLPTLGDYRLMASAPQNTSQGTTVLITGLSQKSQDSTLWKLGWTLGAVALIGLAAAGLLGWAIVRRTLRPLRRVAETATKVTELPLDRGDVDLSVRVPDLDTDPSTEVGQVGAALNRMLGHVDGALAARQASETRARQFVADASHELRTPLAAIRGYAELTHRSRNVIPPELAHAMRRVESESARMTTLVDDLLLLARLDSGRPLDLREMDLSRLIVDVVSDAHIAGAGHVWRLELPEEPVVVIGDGARLHQVLANLVTNARTHTPPGSTVTTALARGPGDWVGVTVTDNGPGIPPEVLPNIFERFARGDTSRSRAAGSTGLGLAIVSAVVTAHHGTVAVTSRPGHTQFTVRLPLVSDLSPTEQMPSQRVHSEGTQPT